MIEAIIRRIYIDIWPMKESMTPAWINRPGPLKNFDLLILSYKLRRGMGARGVLLI